MQILKNYDEIDNEILDGMLKMFGDIPNKEHNPRQFEYFYKIYQYAKDQENKEIV